MTATAMAPTRAVTIAGRRYPVLLPKLRDPRLHVAATLISIQVLGQTVLGFDLSVAQILIAIGFAAVLELVIVAATRQELAWPASALLTGNGVALLLRTPGTVHGDWWSTKGWPIFLAASGISLLSKYAIRVGDRHLFNPSNFGLVVVFLVFGSDRADPQDLWWGPWRPGLVAAIAVIVVGGLTLAVRLKLFSVAATFWVTFASCIAVLAATGHAITARWHLGPLGGWSYWSVFVLSPEIMIFVFFMITDPRTAPMTRVARPVYAAAVGVLAGVLAGLQHTEFATKVSLLLALTIVCGFRPLLERWLPDEREVRLTPARLGGGAVLGVACLGAVFLAGQLTPAPSAVRLAEVSAGGGGVRPQVDLPAGAVPVVSIDDAFDEIPGALTTADAQRIGRDLAENLAIEADAVGGMDPKLAAAAAFGEHLDEVRAQIRAARSAGKVTMQQHELASLRVVLLRDPVSPQAIPQLGVLATGSVTDLTYRGTSAGALKDQQERPLRQVYLVTKVGGHFLIGQVLPTSSPMVVGG